MTKFEKLILKGRVTEMFHRGTSAVNIRRSLSRSGTPVAMSTICNWIKKLKNGDSLINKKIPGRPRSTTEEEDAIIVTEVLKKPMMPIKRHQGRLSRLNEIDVSVGVIIKRLKEKGYCVFKARRKPLINTKNRQHRLERCKARRHWTIADWHKICWSDESKFELFRANKARFVVRKRGDGQALKMKHIVPTFKHGGGSVMVWGAIGPKGVGELYKMNGRYKAEDYKRKILIPLVRKSMHPFTLPRYF